MHKYSLPPGEEVAPNDFERRGGRASSKKWKESVKLFVDGSPGLPIGRWLAQQAPAQVQLSQQTVLHAWPLPLGTFCCEIEPEARTRGMQTRKNLPVSGRHAVPCSSLRHRIR